MFYEKELQFLRDVFEKSHIQLSFVNYNDSVSEIIDESSLSFFANYINGDDSIKNFLPKIESNIVYKIKTPNNFSYVYFMLPKRAEKNILFIGPYLSEVPTDNKVLEIGEQHGIAPKDQKIFSQYYSSIPVIEENSHLFIMLDAFAELIWGKAQYSIIDIVKERQAPVSPINELKENSLDTTLINMKLMEERYAFENEMMSAVSRGQTQKINQLMSAFSEMTFEKRTSDPLRNMKNYCIIMNTLLRKAAESGGVHPIYLDSVSSSFAIKVEQLTSLSSANALMSDMFRSYCRLVRRHSMGDYSPTVQKSIVFIESDLSADLTLSSIAEQQNISPGYLSAVFKKETGKTITEYIREKRIKHAIYLLETTHLQIQTIALHCGIVDLQYFSNIFKKHTGKTPKEYRESIKNSK